ncbi:CPCC family cysteine-rich protein [Nocardioides sp.]|uniref:CPCC family cysteine-rich protein n=1 Tax=Nocardioides sp. TaxID=35761 RepID=UPI0027274740|nr:CPCC family cysteine-rich protein [Nocardioides sp.]MDO9454505.1 CPCC family cysteine-rich protein [Nocardioides sp.]
MTTHATCRCCGFRTLQEPGRYEVCPVCLWEDDGGISPDQRYGGPNGISLVEGQVRFQQEGRSADDAPPAFCARRPRADELKDPSWQPFKA